MNATLRNPATFAVIGLAAALLFAAVWLAAATSDPSWELGVNTLSDMGVSDVSLTENLFNYGCVAAGFLVVLFGLGRSSFGDRAGRASGYLTAAAGLFLALVGVFDKGFGDGNMHLAVAYLFFALLALAVFASIASDWRGRRWAGLAVSVAAVVVTVASLAAGSLALTEAVFVACALVWLIPQSLGMAAPGAPCAQAQSVQPHGG